jgi:hypothetical protein
MWPCKHSIKLRSLPGFSLASCSDNKISPEPWSWSFCLQVCSLLQTPASPDFSVWDVCQINGQSSPLLDVGSNMIFILFLDLNCMVLLVLGTRLKFFLTWQNLSWFYGQMVDALFSSSNTSATILSAIGILRKLCNHPRLVLSCLKETSLQPSSESPADVSSMNRSRIKAQFNEHFQARYKAYIYYCSLALATQICIFLLAHTIFWKKWKCW